MSTHMIMRKKICNSTKSAEQVENKNNTGSKAIESKHLMILQMYSVLIDLYWNILYCRQLKYVFIITIFQFSKSNITLNPGPDSNENKVIAECMHELSLSAISYVHVSFSESGI